jgi:hypothetical protein
MTKDKTAIYEEILDELKQVNRRLQDATFNKNPTNELWFAIDGLSSAVLILTKKVMELDK